MRNRAWLMCRVEDSSLSSTGPLSLKAQEDYLRHFYVDHDLEIVGVSYIWGKSTGEFEDTIIPKAAEHDFDLLLAKSASRIGRDIDKVIELCKTLEECDVGVICVQEQSATPSALKCLFDSEPSEGQGGISQ